MNQQKYRRRAENIATLIIAIPLYIGLLVWQLPTPWYLSQSSTVLFLFPVMAIAVGVRWLLVHTIEGADRAIDRLARWLTKT
jgi:hypothetical protein